MVLRIWIVGVSVTIGLLDLLRTGENCVMYRDYAALASAQMVASIGVPSNWPGSVQSLYQEQSITSRRQHKTKCGKKFVTVQPLQNSAQVVISNLGKRKESTPSTSGIAGNQCPMSQRSRSLK